jgi:hypothetical protein
MDNHCAMNKKKTLVMSVIATVILVLMVPTSMNYVPPSIAQSDETDEGTNSASQDYQEFQSCLSSAEVDGYVTEQQIRDCFAPIYNTGTATGTDTTTTSSDSPAGDEEDTTSTDNTGSEDEGG